MKSLQKIIIFFLVIFSGFNLSAQIVDIRQIRVQGGNVDFIVNSYDRYLSGVTYPIQTKVNITFKVDGASGWELYAWADNDEFISDNGEVFPLEVLDVEFSGYSVLVDGVDDGGASVLNSLFELKNTKELLASGNAVSVFNDPDYTTELIEIEFYITYSIGKLGELMNREEGIYLINLQFEIEATF